MLDFGCGQGDNLIQAKELGFIVHGVEPNDFRRKNCKKKGLTVFKNLSGLKKIMIFSILEMFLILLMIFPILLENM